VRKDVAWLHGDVKTPPFSTEARREAGYSIRERQDGRLLELPHSRPMPSIGPGVHELRIRDVSANWRIIYRIDADAIVIGEVFDKKTSATPKPVIDVCKARFAQYDEG
jgi:phage-related protein